MNLKDLAAAKKILQRRNGNPWFAQGAQEFLEGVLTKDSDVLEIGSGASTIWFAERAKSILSCEENKVWLTALESEIKRLEMRNITLIYDRQYVVNFLLKIKKLFDVILIDAKGGVSYEQGLRSLSVEICVKLLKQFGWRRWNFKSLDRKKYTLYPHELNTSIWEKR